jgi:hypothetical protein
MLGLLLELSVELHDLLLTFHGHDDLLDFVCHGSLVLSGVVVGGGLGSVP